MGITAHWARLNEVSALAVDCHTSLCVHSHPERKEKERSTPQGDMPVVGPATPNMPSVENSLFDHLVTMS